MGVKGLKNCPLMSSPQGEEQTEKGKDRSATEEGQDTSRPNQHRSACGKKGLGKTWGQDSVDLVRRPDFLFRVTGPLYNG